MKLKNKFIHFIGIGGIGMSGLAELCHNSGLQVTGSDLQEGPQVKHLISLGIPVFIGHNSFHIDKKVDTVVYSSAVKQDNIELQEARRRGLGILGRAEALAEMMRLKRGIVVAGAHGKTTTTALLGSAFHFCGGDPTVVAGGRLDAFQSTTCLGRGEWFIAESDESDGSFHHLIPEMAVLTNIDDDHLDFYGSFLKLKESFVEFLTKVPFYGAIIACGDCKNVREVVEKSRRSQKVWFYGFGDQNDFVLKQQKKGYKILFQNQEWAFLKTPLIGEYNVLNALGALVCGWQAGFDKKKFIEGLNVFKGVRRRVELKGIYNGIHFFDDYAHHPTEIKAVLKGIKERFPENPCVALFQPHRYSRLKYCWDAFLNSFLVAGAVYVSEVYSAGESPLSGINSKAFVKDIRHPAAHFISDDLLVSSIAKALKPGDVFITLGAGSVYRFGEEIMKHLKKSAKKN